MHWNAVGTDNPIVSQSIDYFNSKNEALVVMLSPQYFQKSRTAITSGSLKFASLDRRCVSELLTY